MKSIRTFLVCLHCLIFPFIATAMTCNDFHILSFSQTPTICNQNTADASIIISGGSGNYSYEWTDLADNSLISESVATGQLQDEITNLAVGFYKVIVEDIDNNCTLTSYFSIKNQDAPTANIVQAAAPSSCELDNGFLVFHTEASDVNISVIDIDSGEKLTGEFENHTIVGLNSGKYFLQIANNSDCSNYYYFEIGGGEANFEITETITEASCDTNNGSIALNVTNNSSTNITYNWFDNLGNAMNPADPLQLDNLAAGTYTLQASSGAGCESQFQYNVASTTTMRVDITGVLDLRCAGKTNGSFDFRVIDGTAPFTYTIPELNMVGEPITSETTTISDINGGTYTLQVRDVNGCVVISIVDVTEPAPFELSIGGNDATYCRGGDGTICFLLMGGTPPYRISDASNDYGVFEASSEMQCVENLTAASYDLVITDDGGCILNAPTITIAEPDNCTCCDDFRLLNTSETAANCGSTNGVSSITMDGGSGNYTITWYDALTNQIVDDQSSSSATIDATGMSPGTYYAIAEDSDCACIPERHDFTINESNAPNVNIIFENTSLLCPDETRASFEFEVVGGTEPHTYQILGSNISGNVTDTRSTLIDNLGAGNYVVEVTDMLGCKGYSTLITTDAPPPIVANAAALDIAQCNDDRNGNIALNLSGGTPPYRVTTSSDDFGFFNEGQHFLNALTEGTYNFDITDNNGCTSNTGDINIATIFNCADCNCTAFDLQDISSSPESCAGNDGSIDLSLSSGVGPFTFTLRQAGNTLIQYQDKNTAFSFNGLPAGDYDIDVVDANCDCEILNQGSTIGSSGIEVAATPTDISCSVSEGQICMTISGGNAPYAVNDGTADVGTFDEATEQCLSNLTAGDYNYSITDADGCSTSQAFSIQSSEANINADRTLAPATQGNNNGEVCLTISGGTAPYQVTDDNRDYGSFAEATEQCVSDLAAGDYTVNIADAGACSTTLSFTIDEAIVPDNIQVEVTSNTDASCTDGDGEFCLNVSGGTAPYTLTDGDFTVSDIPEATETCANNVSTGTYNFTVSDSDGNTAPQTLAVTIGQASANISATSTTIGESCAGDDGEFCLTITGGTAPYNVNDGTTDFGSFDENTERCISNLSSGIYALNITDADNCTVSEQVVVGLQANNIVTTPTTSDATCGNSDGEICLIISGGTAPYTVSDSSNDYGSFDEATEDCLPNLGAGDYTFNITDANGCQAAPEVFTINAPNHNNNITIISNVTAGCSNNSGAVCLTISGGTAPYEVSEGDAVFPVAFTEGEESCLDNFSNGTFTLTIIDDNGCTASETVTVSQEAGNSISIAVSDKVACSGVQNCVVIGGGNAPYALQIGSRNFENIGEDTEYCFTALPNGFHNFEITDNTGCLKSQTLLISNPDNGGENSINIGVNTQEAACNGIGGQVCLTISGGVAPYSVRELDAVFPVDFGEGVESCLDNFLAGTVVLTITDSEGCSVDESVTVGTATSNISAIATTNPTTCDGGDDGEICLDDFRRNSALYSNRQQQQFIY